MSLSIDRRFLAQSTWWINIDQGVRALTDLGIAVLLTRLVSQEIYGQYQLLVSLFMVMAVSCLSGFNGSLLRAMANSYDGTWREVTRLSWRWSVVGVVVMWAFGGYWLARGAAGVGWTMVLAGIVMPFFHIRRRWQVVLHAKEKFKQRAVYNSLSSAALITAMAAAAAVWPDQIVNLFLVNILVQTIWHTWWYERTLVEVKNDRVEEGWRSSGYKLLAAEVFGVAYAHLDKLLLAVWLGAEQLAIYAVAIMLGEGVKLFLANFIAIYIPRLHQRGAAKAYKKVMQHKWWLAGGLVSVMVIMWAVIPWLLVSLFTGKYTASVPYAQLYLLVIPWHFIASLAGYMLIREKKEGYYTRSMVVAGLVNVLMYIVLIPWWGIYGAVLGSIGYYAVMGALLVFKIVTLVRRGDVK